ncbi:MAG: hypothetical protein ACKVTZ_04655 [Bacteroidia bacterium]
MKVFTSLALVFVFSMGLSYAQCSKAAAATGDAAAPKACCKSASATAASVKPGAACCKAGTSAKACAGMANAEKKACTGGDHANANTSETVTAVVEKQQPTGVNREEAPKTEK